MKDPELSALANNQSGSRVWIDLFEYTFGQIKNSQEHVLRIHNQILEFQQAQDNAVFVFFVGAVNHWVALVVHKPAFDSRSSKTQKRIRAQEKYQSKFYLLDSSNITHLKESTDRLPDVVNERVFEKVLLGLKATDKFMTQMTIQSLFD
jgi:hypothetical protein